VQAEIDRTALDIAGRCCRPSGNRRVAARSDPTRWRPAVCYRAAAVVAGRRLDLEAGGFGSSLISPYSED
jgi:hypothetical protein